MNASLHGSGFGCMLLHNTLLRVVQRTATHMPRQHIIVDSYLLTDNVIPPDLAKAAFEALRKELSWKEMYHRGGAVPRLVCIQGKVEEDGTEPIYRHPVDEQPLLSPFTPTVEKLRSLVSANIGGQPLNHALIQWYRNSDDYISEHADKTIDVKKGSSIVNLSIGAERSMILRPKKDAVPKGHSRSSTKFALPHGSIFVLGWETNRTMTHEIKRDKRHPKFKSAAELDFDGQRISLTFRNVATYLRPDGTLVGQGAAKTATGRSSAEEEEALLNAFSTENKSSTCSWEALYGEGFSVINFKITNERNSVGGGETRKEPRSQPPSPIHLPK